MVARIHPDSLHTCWMHPSLWQLRRIRFLLSLLPILTHILIDRFINVADRGTSTRCVAFIPMPTRIQCAPIYWQRIHGLACDYVCSNCRQQYNSIQASHQMHALHTHGRTKEHRFVIYGCSTCESIESQVLGATMGVASKGSWDKEGQERANEWASVGIY